MARTLQVMKDCVRPAAANRMASLETFSQEMIDIQKQFQDLGFDNTGPNAGFGMMQDQ